MPRFITESELRALGAFPGLASPGVARDLQGRVAGAVRKDGSDDAPDLTPDAIMKQAFNFNAVDWAEIMPKVVRTPDMIDDPLVIALQRRARLQKEHEYEAALQALPATPGAAKLGDFGSQSPDLDAYMNRGTPVSMSSVEKPMPSPKLPAAPGPVQEAYKQGALAAVKAWSASSASSKLAGLGSGLTLGRGLTTGLRMPSSNQMLRTQRASLATSASPASRHNMLWPMKPPMPMGW